MAKIHQDRDSPRYGWKTQTHLPLCKRKIVCFDYLTCICYDIEGWENSSVLISHILRLNFIVTKSQGKYQTKDSHKFLFFSTGVWFLIWSEIQRTLLNQLSSYNQRSRDMDWIPTTQFSPCDHLIKNRFYSPALKMKIQTMMRSFILWRQTLQQRLKN